MNQPKIELIPLRSVTYSDRPSTIDLIIRIVPPANNITPNRPPLNLGFVLDRSGSMSGKKIQFVRQAASYAVQHLQGSDRLSVTIFDDQITTIVPNTWAVEKTRILQQIEQIQPRGSTALHAGWIEGATQVSQHLDPEYLNRVILLSDGLANVGETNPDTIATDVHGLAKRGVSTTTMGVGDDYCEDLMEAIARSGDGNYYYIASPDQLPEIFQTELRGLMATLGHTVSLGIEPQTEVELIDVFNDLEKNQHGRYMLPNLVAGSPIDIVIRLKIPPMSSATNLCHFRLAWSEPNQEQRQILRTTLNLPVIPFAQSEEFSPNPEVQQQVARLMAVRAKQEAIKNLDQGDIAATGAALQQARIYTMLTSPSSQRNKDLDALAEIELDLSSGNYKRARKQATYQNYQTRRGTELREQPDKQ